MTFSERMKELLDQGMAVSKEMLDQGIAASKEFAIKAGARAQDLGERGVLMVEIKRLEYRAEKLLGQLGNEVYRAFTERGQEAVERNMPEIQTIMEDISKLKETLEQKESELKLRRG